MMRLDEDALICDFAETYHIYDYRSLPVPLAATLSAGLRENSRIKLKAAESSVSLDTLILAAIADNLTLLRASLSKKEGNRKLFLFMEAIQGEKKHQTKAMNFRSAEDFEATLKRIRGE